MMHNSSGLNDSSVVIPDSINLLFRDAVKRHFNILVVGESDGLTSPMVDFLKAYIPKDEPIISFDTIGLTFDFKVNDMNIKQTYDGLMPMVHKENPLSKNYIPKWLSIDELRGEEVSVGFKLIDEDVSLITSMCLSDASVAVKRLVHMLKLDPERAKQRDEVLLQEVYGHIDLVIGVKKETIQGFEQTYVSDIFYYTKDVNNQSYFDDKQVYQIFKQDLNDVSGTAPRFGYMPKELYKRLDGLIK